MREILFRAKDLHTDKWRYGGVATMDTGETVIVRPDGWTLEVDPETVGQYTDCKDVNDGRVFEGDVVTGINGKHDLSLVYWDWYENAFKCKPYMRTSGFYLNVHADEITIIGNIHDNPGLMEGKNDV